MSNSDNSKIIPSNSRPAPTATTTPTTTATENELDDLVSQLRQTINKSDWLKHNTSAKWEQENPELAKQWREAINVHQTDDIAKQ